MAEYSNYNNIFLVENAIKLSENTEMNRYAIKLEKGKQPSFGFIYSLRLIMLETLKTYIKTNLVNNFIWFSKFLARVFILFDKKLDEILYFCVNYWGFNNLTIKNQYLLFLISKSLDWFEWTKSSTQLNLTNANH